MVAAVSVVLVMQTGALYGMNGFAESPLRDSVTNGTLQTSFLNPPSGAKPWVFWYWRGGYISEAGIDADLKALNQAGIGGVILCNVDRLVKQGPVRLYTPEWFRLMKHAIKTAAGLGMDVDLYNGPGWSSSGGPWITPEYAMKKLTWSESQVEGGGVVEVKLPKPPFLQNVTSVPSEPPIDCNWYRDGLVLAFPTPEMERTSVPMRISSDDPGFDATQLNRSAPALAGAILTFDSGKNMAESGVPSYAKLVFGSAKKPAVFFDYEEPFAPASLVVRFRLPRNAVKNFELFSSADGISWNPVVKYEKKNLQNITHIVPISSAPARKWKLVFEPVAPNQDVWFSDLALLPGRRIGDWTAKAGFDRYGTEASELTADHVPDGSGFAVDKAGIIDVTSSMKPDGTLVWDAPKGSWTVLRLGYCLTGGITIPTPAGGQGLDCDKFNRAAVDFQWQHAMTPFLSDPDLKDTVKYVHIDSWEVGEQNWTDDFPQKFRRFNNYDIREYLPVLTGRIVGSLDESERFLTDFRRTISSLIVNEYFGYTKELASRHGILFSNEPYHQDHFNSMEAGMQSDMPMCEIWQGDGRPTSASWYKVAVSPARMAGRELVGCEALTSNTRPNEGGDYSKAPWDFKVKTDWMLAGGITRMVLHVSAHNPWPDLEPGLTLGTIGQHFERSNTWWPLAYGFTRYITRAQYLLRQGLPVADMLYSSGEAAPETGSRHPDVSGRGDPSRKPPTGYDYDTCAPEVLFNRLRVENGRLVLPDGLSYRLLVLPKDEPMSVRMAERVLELVEAGATVLGNRPERTSGLPVADESLSAVADKLWGAGSTSGQAFDRPVGKGWIISGKSVADVLGEIGLQPDFTAQSGAGDKICFTHRSLPDGSQIYWIANSADEPLSFDGLFRVTGLHPELWNPMTGKIEAPPGFNDDGKRTQVPLQLPERGSTFVVFVPESSASPVATGFETVKTLNGPWQVRFQTERGGPDAPVEFASLTDWKEHADKRIRYFSGIADYHILFEGPASAERMILDLGKVCNVAEVVVNGQPAGVVWAAPWQLDVTPYLKAGTNNLEIRVANTWVNRLIGDEQLPLDYGHDSAGLATEIPPKWYLQGKPRQNGRVTFTTFAPWNADSPLVSSGLLGPVRILKYKRPL